MPQVTLRTGIVGADGKEEVLIDYLCDWPNCPNVAKHTVGIIRELRRAYVVCPEHAATLQRRAQARRNGPTGAP